MSRLLLLLLLISLIAHIMGVQSHSESRMAAHEQAEAEHLMDMLTSNHALMDEEGELDDEILDDTHLDDEAFHDMQDHSEMDEMTTSQIQQSTSFLESMATTSSSAGVSYIAFGDRALQGGPTQYGVVLNGKPCGTAVGVTGGLSYFDIIEETNLETGLTTKKFGKKNVATINVAFDRPNPILTKWIQQTLKGRYPLRSGSIQADDGDGNLKAKLTFHNAYMSEVTFPRFSLDDASPAIWKLKISPQSTRLYQAKEGQRSTFREIKEKKFKPYANNFRFSIQHIDPPADPEAEDARPTIRWEVLKGVRLIESFIVKTRRGNPEQNITPLYSVGNLVLEVSQDKAGDLFNWMERQHRKKKNGAISVYKPSGKLFYTISLKRMGIYKVHPMRAKPKEKRWLRVELFVEQVKFDFNNSKSKKPKKVVAPRPPPPEGDDTTVVVADEVKIDVQS